MTETSDRERHWDAVYTARPDSELSWFAAQPALSLSMLDALAVTPEQAVLDVGAGASRLVDVLIDRSFTDVSVLDISEAGLDAARKRLGETSSVHWVNADVLGWSPTRRYELWHDRAVFHFLTAEADRDRYRAVLGGALAPGGAVVLATFAADGPTHCSGLPVQGYSAAELVEALGPGFDVVAHRREEHRTPAGVVQPFTWLAARLRSG